MQSNRVRKFLLDLIELSKQHGVHLTHEDAHGAFEVCDRGQDDESYLDSWLMDAIDSTIPDLPSAETPRHRFAIPKPPLVPCLAPTSKPE